MFVAVVVLTMLVLPAASVVVAHIGSPAEPILDLIGRWFVFWAAGVRLGLAGLRQILQPAYTAHSILRLEGDSALVLVRELGLANLATAVVSLASLIHPTFTLPAAISAGIFFAGAGIGHVRRRKRTLEETVAMASDLFIAVILLTFALLQVL